MNNWQKFSLASLVLCTACLLAGCQHGNAQTTATQNLSKAESTTPKVSPEQKAIEAVLGQLGTATTKWTNSIAALQADPVSGIIGHKLGDICEQYHDDLVAIDIKDCPTDFRIAFVKYYQAVRSMKSYADSVTGWRGMLKGAVDIVGAVVQLPGNTDKAVEPLEQAVKELELVCVKYNVQLK